MDEMNKMQAAFRAMKAWGTFKKNHPKFEPFMRAVQAEGIREGTVLEMTFQSPEGKTLTTNVKIQETDLELFEVLHSVLK